MFAESIRHFTAGTRLFAGRDIFMKILELTFQLLHGAILVQNKRHEPAEGHWHTTRKLPTEGLKSLEHHSSNLFVLFENDGEKENLKFFFTVVVPNLVGFRKGEYVRYDSDSFDGSAVCTSSHDDNFELLRDVPIMLDPSCVLVRICPRHDLSR